MKAQLVSSALILASQLFACGDDTGTGGSATGGEAAGGQAAGGQAAGGQAAGGQAEGGASAGGAPAGGEAAGGAGACVPSGSGSAADVDCNAYCTAVVAEDCDNGPPTIEACATVCESLKKDCPGYDNLVDCAGADPDYACDANGMVSTVGCEAVYESCLVPCFEG
jgi:hypothetical protein